ncbi:MAG: hypothetical protein ACRDV0_04680 [Acidimicrobiales bacterium]
MDIEAFYEQNEARRESAEIEFGDDWSDASGNRYELSWVETTGEFYLMIEPDAYVSEDNFGDFAVADEPVSELSVVVVGVATTRSAAEDALAGWESAMVTDNSLDWLYDRMPSPGDGRDE